MSGNVCQNTRAKRRFNNAKLWNASELLQLLRDYYLLIIGMEYTSTRLVCKPEVLE